MRQNGQRRGSQSAPVVVCGGGAAGTAAALAAARRGVPVYLVETHSQIGGTVSHALIHTLAGLYDSRGELINNGLAAELTARLQEAACTVRKRKIGRTWVLNVDPDVYQRVLNRWVRDESPLTVLCRSWVSDVFVTNRRIDGLQICGANGVLRLRPRAVVDATGNAEIVRIVDPNLISKEDGRAAGGLIFTMRGVSRGALEFPKKIGLIRSLQAAAESGKVPTECGKTWIDSGVHEDEVYVKLFVPLPDGWRQIDLREQLIGHAHQCQAHVVDLLRSCPDFAEARISRTGTLGVRDGGRVLGEYVLTATDVRSMRKFSDAVCRCCWPIEYWDPLDGVSVEYLPENEYYEVPLGCLRVKGFENLWVAGKCLSADPMAQASVRVAGTCWAMGEAAGHAAAEQ